MFYIGFYRFYIGFYGLKPNRCWDSTGQSRTGLSEAFKGSEKLSHADRQTDRQSDRQRDGHTRQRDGQTYRHTCRHIETLI